MRAALSPSRLNAIEQVNVTVIAYEGESALRRHSRSAAVFFVLARRLWSHRASHIVKIKSSDGKRKLLALGGGSPIGVTSKGSQFGGVAVKGSYEIYSMTYSGDNGMPLKSLLSSAFLTQNIEGVLKWQREEILGNSLAAVSSSQVFCRQNGLIYVFGGKREDKWQFRLRTLRFGTTLSLLSPQTISPSS